MDANVLTGIAGGFRLSTVTETPVRHSVRLTLPGGLSLADGRLVADDPFQLTRYLPAKPVDVDLTLLLKNVRFADAALTRTRNGETVPSAETIGGMPITPPLAAGTALLRVGLGDLLAEHTTSPADVGVPGLLGSITGTLCLPVEEVVEQVTQRPVRLELRLDVLEDGAPAGEVTYSAGVTPRPDGGAETPAPVTAPPELVLTFPLRFTELTQPGPPPLTTYVLRASVRLSVEAAPEVPATGAPEQLAVTTGWVELPEVTVPVPRVPVPTIVAMFTDKDYSGKALVVVPANSAVGGATLSVGDALAVTGDLLRRIDASHRLVTFLAGPAGTALAGLVPTQYQVLLAATDSIHDLSLHEFTPFPNRLTAEDSISSIVVVAPPGRKVNFNLERTREDNTASSSPIVTTIDLFLAVANLAAEDANGNPVVTAGGTVDNWGHPGPRNDRLSAIYFP